MKWSQWAKSLLSGVFLASVSLNCVHWLDAEADPATGDPALGNNEGVPGRADSSCLDLSGVKLRPEQLAQLEACGAKCSEKEASLSIQIAEVRGELQAFLSGESTDRDAALKLTARLNELRAEAVLNCVTTVLDVRDALTAKQREQLQCCCDPSCCVLE